MSARFITALFFALSCSFYSGFVSAGAEVSVGHGQITALSPYLEYAIDEGGEISAQQLYANQHDLQFQAVTSQSMPALYKNIWYRFKVKNTSANDLVLVVNFDELLFDELIFVYHFQGELLQFKAGLNHPFSQRPIDYRYVAMPLKIAAEESQTVYFKIYSSHIPLVAPVIAPALKFAGMVSTSTIVNLLFIGIGIGLCIFMAIFMPMAMARREAWGYIAYVMATTAVIISVSGLWQFFLPDHPQWHKFLMVALLAINCISNLTMVNAFFEVHRRNPLLHKCYLVAYVFYASFIFIYPFVGGYETLMLPLIGFTLLMFIFLFGTALMKYRQGYSNAGLFLFAMSIFFVTCTYAALGGEGLLPYNAIIRHSVASGIIIQSAVVCLAIARKANAEKKIHENLANDVAIANAASREKSHFLATMSHEIRTPVNGVLGMAQMLQSTQLNVEQAHYTGVILNSGNTLLAVINDILDFSKIEAGKMELEETPFDLQEVLTYTEALFAPQAEAKGLRFIIKRDENCVTQLCGDPIRLQQILNNLLSNAFKFTEAGSITVAIRSHGMPDDKVSLFFSVQDSGIGIAKETQPQLFNAFTQADKSTTRTYGGTGLGLAISQQLVQLMGGEIGLISDTHQGAEFWFTGIFKISPASEMHGANESENPVLTDKPLNRKDAAPVKLLIAEDNPINRQVITAMLNKLGFEAVIGEDGVEALRLFEQAPESFAAILMDLEMPNKDGYATAMAIRAIEQELNLAPLPIIALTAHVMEANINRCYEAGMDEVLTKPIQLTQLMKTLNGFGLQR